MSGVKTLVNQCDSDITITLFGREGSDPMTPSDRRTTVTVPAHGTDTDVRYGDDQNPYLNGLEITWDDPDQVVIETLIVIKRGDDGTLDNKLNAYDTLIISFNSSLSQFTLTSENRES